MPVVSFACLLLTPIQSLSRKRGEEKPELEHKVKQSTPPANSSVLDDPIVSGETKMETKFSVSKEPAVSTSQGPYYPGNSHISSQNTNPSKQDDAEAQTSIQSRLSDFDKLSMSVDHSLETVKNPLNERQGYFPSILSPSNYVNLKSPNDIGHPVPTRSNDKSDRSPFYKSKKRPPVEATYFPSPGPGTHKTKLYSFDPEAENYKTYIYPTSSGPKYSKPSFSPTAPTGVSGYETGNTGYGTGASGYGTAADSFGIDLKPMKPHKKKLKTVQVRYKELTPDEESLLNFPDFTDESKENTDSSSSEHKYQLDENEEPNEEEIEVEPEREVEEEEDEEAPIIQHYPPKIKLSKPIYRRPVIKEIIKVPVQKDQIKQYNVKRPQSYVENTVRHHEVSIKNTYPATGPVTIKASAIPELIEEVKPFRGPLLRAPSSGSPTSARVAPLYIYPVRPMSIRPMTYVKPGKEITIYTQNRNRPIVLGPPKMSQFDHLHRHRHRHLPMCAPCLTQPHKSHAHSPGHMHFHPRHHHHHHHHPHHHHPHSHRMHHHSHRPHSHMRLHSHAIHKALHKHKPGALGCVSPLQNGQFRVASPYSYYNYNNVKGSPYASAYPMYYPQLNPTQLITPYKTIQSPPQTYAKYHYYMKYPAQFATTLLGTKPPTAYEVQESGEEEESEGAPQTSQEEYEGGGDGRDVGDDDELRQEIDTDYEHARYHTDQHYKPEEEASVTETYTDYGHDGAETVVRSSGLPRKTRSSPYIYSHQIHYF